MKSQTSKISIAVIIAVILVGGVYLWEKQGARFGGSKQSVLLTDNDYHLQLAVTEKCKDYFSITREEKMDAVDPALRTYNVNVSDRIGSWYTYAIYSQEEYDKLITYGFPRTPIIMAKLDTKTDYDGLLFTMWRPLDAPSGSPASCGLDSIQMMKL